MAPFVVNKSKADFLSDVFTNWKLKPYHSGSTISTFFNIPVGTKINSSTSLGSNISFFSQASIEDSTREFNSDEVILNFNKYYDFNETDRQNFYWFSPFLMLGTHFQKAIHFDDLTVENGYMPGAMYLRPSDLQQLREGKVIVQKRPPLPCMPMPISENYNVLISRDDIINFIEKNEKN
jgi:hypothetical protein